MLELHTKLLWDHHRQIKQMRNAIIISIINNHLVQVRDTIWESRDSQMTLSLQIPPAHSGGPRSQANLKI